MWNTQLTINLPKIVHVFAIFRTPGTIKQNRKEEEEEKQTFLLRIPGVAKSSWQKIAMKLRFTKRILIFIAIHINSRLLSVRATHSV